jgi:TolB-like protein/Tfp pilus assembly protein PilF
MMFCLDDGAELLYGPAAGSEPPIRVSAAVSASGVSAPAGSNIDEPQTAILNTTDTLDDTPTHAQSHTTQGSTALPFGTGGDKRSKTFDRRSLVLLALISIVAAAGYIGYRYVTPVTSGQINSIAVLPFENRSGDPDSEYLSDGLSDSLIYRLSQLPNLKVSPTSSVLRYKGKAADVAEIAKELEVDAVMSGKLAQRGDDLTISVELVDARSKKLIWAEQYDRKMADLLATQREIAATITEKLQLKLAGDETRGITKKYTDSNEAYQLYMRGRYSFAKRTKEEMLRSIDYFNQAVKLDPKFALAYARISEVYGSMPAYPYLSPKQAFPEAKAAAEKALEIDPTLSEAHTFLAYAQVIYDWNWTDGERSFKRAIKLDPNNFSAHFRYGQIYLLPVSRFDAGIGEMTQGLNAEPLDVNMGISVAWGELVRGHNDKALQQVRKFYDLEPNHPLSQWVLAQVLNEMGKYDEAISLCEKWLQRDPDNQLAIRDAGVAYAKAGRRDKAEEMIARYRELAKTEWVPTGRIAAIYAALGEKDKAFAELEKAFQDRDWDMHRLNIEVYMRPLHDDPRFAGFVKRLNLPQ